MQGDVRLDHLALIGELATEVHVPVLGNHGRVPEGCLLGKNERERVDRKRKLKWREHARARERKRETHDMTHLYE